MASKGRNAEAFDILFNARTLDPKAPDVESNLGTVTAALNRTDEADDHFHRAISMAGDQAASYFRYATWLEQQRSHDDALEAYSWASALAPTDLRPRYGMMREYGVTKHWADLRRTVDDAKVISPGDPNITQFETLLHNHPDTVKAAEELVKEHPSPETYVELSNAYCDAGEYTKCLDATQKALQMQPDYVPAYINAGSANMALGRLDEAIALAKKALSYDPDNKIAHDDLNVWERERMVVGNSIMRK
jgi:tetratricopeptide (TPR) repeat protein